MLTTRKRRGIAAAAVGAGTTAAAILVAVLPAGASTADPVNCNSESSDAAGLTCPKVGSGFYAGVLAGLHLDPATCPDSGALVSLQVLLGTDSTALANARTAAHSAMMANKTAEVTLNKAQDHDSRADLPTTAGVPKDTIPEGTAADTQDTALAAAQADALAKANTANAADAKVDRLQRAENRDVSAIAVIKARIVACTTVMPTPVPTTTPVPAPPTTIVEPGPTTVIQQPGTTVVEPAPAPVVVPNNLPVTG